MSVTRDNKSILAAWFTGIGITVYRGWKYRQNNGKPVKAPPSPGELAKTAVFFAMLALLNEAVKDEDAHHAISLVAWGVDLAAVVNLVSGHPNPIPGGPWPPAIASNKVIIPGGESGKDSFTNPGPPGPPPGLSKNQNPVNPTPNFPGQIPGISPPSQIPGTPPPLFPRPRGA